MKLWLVLYIAARLWAAVPYDGSMVACMSDAGAIAAKVAASPDPAAQSAKADCVYRKRRPQ